MWEKWKFWDKGYEKSMLRAFARSRAKNVFLLMNIFFSSQDMLSQKILLRSEANVCNLLF